ncbi:IS21 family transposase, partial [Virgibacillus siamensis]
KWAETIGPSMVQFVSYILEINAKKKALNILSALRNLSTKYAKEEIEKATKTLLEISTNPTISVLKGVLDRSRKRKKKSNIDNQQNNTNSHGFVRGAEYFGGNK